jgi:hypothetical protein
MLTLAGPQPALGQPVALDAISPLGTAPLSPNVSPNMYAWIERDENGVTAEGWLKFGPLKITFLAFDEPYVRAAGPRAALLLPQMADDFGVNYTGNRTYFVRLNSFPASDDWFGSGSSRESVIPSPLAPGFFIGSAQSPEEYLLAYLTDYLGHRLLADEFGERAQEPARLALAHAAVQWEVEQAVGRDSSANLRSQVVETRTPLTVLLDPTKVDAAANMTAERDLFLRFALAQYGRGIITPYLRAVFNAYSAEKLVRQAFQQEPEEIEQQWQEWMD